MNQYHNSRSMAASRAAFFVAVFALSGGCTVVNSREGEMVVTRGTLKILPSENKNSPHPAPAQRAASPPQTVVDRRMIEDAARELVKMREKLALLENEIKAAVNDRDTAIKSIDKANAELAGIRRTINAVEQHLQRLLQNKIALEKEFAAFAAHRDEAQVRLSATNDEIVALGKDRDKAQTRLAEINNEIVTLSKVRDKAHARLAEINDEIAARQKQLADSLPQLSKVGLAVSLSQFKLKEVNADLAARKEQLRQIDAMIDSRQHRLTEIEDRLDRARDNVEAAADAEATAVSVSPVEPDIEMAPGPADLASANPRGWSIGWLITPSIVIAALLLWVLVLRARHIQDRNIQFDLVDGDGTVPLSFALGSHDGISIIGGMKSEPVEMIDGPHIRSNRRGRVTLTAQAEDNVAHNGVFVDGTVTLDIGDRIDAEADGSQRSYVFRGQADDISDIPVPHEEVALAA